MTNIIEKILAILGVIVIGFSGYIYITSENSNSTYLLNLKPVIIYTDQMQPDLKKNSIAIIKKTDKVEVGDIITYVYQDKLTTHKLKSYNNDGTINTGSNYADDTYHIKKEQIDGKVIGKINVFNNTIANIRKKPILGVAMFVFKILQIIFIALFLKNITEYILVKKGILEYEEND